MGVPAYLFNDYIKDLAAASITTTGSFDTNYPKTNMQNEQIALATRTTNKTTIKLRFDLGSTKALRAFYIGNHNFSGGTFTINSYTDVAYSANVEVVELNKTVRLLDVYHHESSVPTARQYWELDLANVTSADSYYEWGRIMAYDGSNPVQLTFNPDFMTARGYGFRNIINETSCGVRWVHRLAKKRERFSLTWNERAGTTLASELRTLYEAVYGNAYPFVYIPDITGAACHYVYIDDPELLYQEIFGTATTSRSGGATLNLSEAIRGKV